ncbi:MAG: oxygen-independent coproporphyrinogen III oxidase [Pseudomonadota bacterium]
MEQVNIFRQHGLFDAKVPRYTSYPPANRFEADIGAQVQRGWLRQVPADQPLSLYVHIPFCRRLCWFCACRTQGTKTLAPVEAYVETLLHEIETTAGGYLSPGMKMARLHLGGGTPTLLNPDLLHRLMERLHHWFAPTPDFEFSVEIDPTEAPPKVLDALSNWSMTRASVGVQDFAPEVQKAIGREQSFDVTRDVIAHLRAGGVTSLNIDMLYGLPHQTDASMIETLDKVVSLHPDRLALYGYAHVPHMSKRQVMIPGDALPEPEPRFLMSEIARRRLTDFGYVALGIDHFADAHDSLTQAAQAGRMKRNFQGYTDDPCSTILSFGASGISTFPQGYVQNAVATSAYTQRVRETGLAGHKGYELTGDDKLIAAMIQGLMCNGVIDLGKLRQDFPRRQKALNKIVDTVIYTFPGILSLSADKVTLPKRYMASARVVAARMDAALTQDHQHSLAI